MSEMESIHEEQRGSVDDSQTAEPRPLQPDTTSSHPADTPPTQPTEDAVPATAAHADGAKTRPSSNRKKTPIAPSASSMDIDTTTRTNGAKNAGPKAKSSRAQPKQPGPARRKKPTETQPVRQLEPAAQPPLAPSHSAPIPEQAFDVEIRKAAQENYRPPATNHVSVEMEIPISGATAAPTTANAASGGPIDFIHEMEMNLRNQASQKDGLRALINDFSAGLLHLVGENMERMTPPQMWTALDMLRGVSVKDYLDPDFWKGVGMVLDYQIKEQMAFIQRRLRGEYEVDTYGMDRELIEVVRPFMVFMYRTWWRTSVEGLEHVPDMGRALLVANHSGVLPWDGAMIATAMAEDHPSGSQRIVRNLYLDWFNRVPFMASALTSIGHVADSPENVSRLLDDDELACVFPEGPKGSGKLYRDRYRLARFGRGGFVQAALRTGAPLIPVAVIGSEEIYPMLANVEPLAKVFGLPYFPITPFFPWLGPLGAIPLPTRWRIIFCPPFSTNEYGPDAADDSLIVFMFSEQVRSAIQETISARLAERKSVF